MKTTGKKLIALLMCLVLLMSMVTTISADTGSGEDGQASSGFSWEEVEDGPAPEILSGAVETEEDEQADAVDPDTEVRVAIVFEGDSAIEAGYSATDIASNDEALAYMEDLEESQSEVLEAVAETVYDGESLETVHSFTLTTNAVTAEVAYGDIEAIEAVDGVAAVYVQNQYEVQEAEVSSTTAADMIGSTTVWAEGYTGAGMKIAIIDTGIDIDHQSFSEQGYLYSLEQLEDDSYTETWLTADQVAAILPYLNASATYEAATGETLSVADVYQNAKVPFAYNYVDEDLDITHDNDDMGDHGTHVTGIAAANRYIYIDGEYVDAFDASGIYATGVAYDAQILTMKVFGKDGGAWTEDYVAAIEDAILLGADAVNLSLGSTCAGMVESIDEWEQEVFESLSETDTVVNIAAGNSSYWSEESNFGLNLTEDTNMSTVEEPSTYENAMSVASADNTGSVAYGFEAAGIEVSYNESLGYGNAAFHTLDTTEDGDGTVYTYVILAPGMIGDEEELAAVDAALKEAGDADGLAGKIVFIQRGELTFVEKAVNALTFGAVATVIYNNTDGEISMDLSDYEEYGAPVVSILRQEAYDIMENSQTYEFSCDSEGQSETAVCYTGTVTVYGTQTRTTSDNPTAASMSSFSSWGITGSLTIKPEITAPGGSIWSTIDDNDYAAYSGTSMATPSMSGMSALVLQYIYGNNALNSLVESGTYTARALAQSLLMGTAIPLIDEENSGLEYSVRQQGSGLASVQAAVTSTAFLTVEGQDDGKVKAELGDDADRDGVYTFTFTVTNFGDETVSYLLDTSVLTADVLEEEEYVYMDTTETELDAVADYALVTDGILIYDLNGDDAVDALDALLVLQYANDKDTLTEEQLAIADLDGDGDVDTADAYLWLVYIEEGGEITYAATATLTEDNELSVEAGTSASVTVTIRLAEEGKAWLDEYYPNGGYVEGYVYLNASAGDDEEGVITAVDQSIPYLAYYGSWAEPSMFERSVLIEDDVYGPTLNYNTSQNGWDYYNYDEFYGWLPDNSEVTNYYTLLSYGSEYLYYSNFYVRDAEYISDRNAINTLYGDTIASVTFSLIRNSAAVWVQIADAETGEVYYYEDLGAYYAEYYDADDTFEWADTSYTAEIGWAGTDAYGNELPEGTKVIVQLVAVTEYTDEDGNYIVGDGSTLDLPLTIDYTEPVATAITYENGELEVTVSDNQYVAAVYLSDEDYNTISAIAVNQTEPGWDVETTINLGDLSDLAQEQDTSIFYVDVIDYAGNYLVYRIKLDDSEEYAEEAESVSILLDGEEIESFTLYGGGSKTLTAYVLPKNAEDRSVSWTSSDESVAVIDEYGEVTAVGEGTAVITAVSNLTPSVWATCEVEVVEIDVDLYGFYWDEDGDGYEAIINTLSLDGDFENVLALGENDFLCQALAGDTLYVATDANDDLESDIYTLDLTTGETVYIDTVEMVVDMAYSPLLGSAGSLLSATSTMVYCYDLETGEYECLYAFEEDILSGITHVATQALSETETADIFLLIDTDGDLYCLTLWVDTSADEDQVTVEVTELGNTGIDSLWSYNSLYYYESEDGEEVYLFFSVWNFAYDNSDLYVILLGEDGVEETTLLGSSQESVYPITGLFSPESEASENSLPDWAEEIIGA